MSSKAQNRKFQSRLQTRILFALLISLMLAAVLYKFDYEDEQKVQWLQVGLIAGMMCLGLFELRRTNHITKHLAEVADEIGSGAFHQRADVKTRDNLGSLAQALNAMADQIERNIHEREQAEEALRQSQAALAAQNQELAKAYERQKRFGDFLSELNSIEVTVIAEKALSRLASATNAQLATFYIAGPEPGVLTCLATQGVDPGALNEIREDPAPGGLPHEVLRRHGRVEVEDLQGLSLNLGIGSVPLRYICGLPVIFRDKVLAVIVLACLRRPDAQQVIEINLHLDALANALNNALSYRALDQQSVLLEKMNRDLRKVDRLRSEFVANMSHELRTPLNSIIGFSGILLKHRTANLAPEDIDRAEKIHRNGKHLLELINGILDLSKIEAGRMELAFAPVGVGGLMREVADMLQTQAEAKSLNLRLELPPLERTIVTDAQKLRQVLINLTGNAIKFTRQGSVTLRLEPFNGDAAHAILRVTDTGIGIPKDKLDTIFEAFRQVDSGTAREFGGTGLGLTISRSFVQMLGGALSVASEPGLGSTFTVRLPIKPPADHGRSATPPAIVQPPNTSYESHPADSTPLATNVPPA